MEITKYKIKDKTINGIENAKNKIITIPTKARHKDNKNSIKKS